MAPVHRPLTPSLSNKILLLFSQEKAVSEKTLYINIIYTFYIYIFLKTFDYCLIQYIFQMNLILISVITLFFISFSNNMFIKSDSQSEKRIEKVS